MTERKEQVERRQHIRFRVREGAFAVLTPNFTVVGEIIDISKEGLAFRYITSEDRSSQSSGLDILFAGGSYCLRDVPFKTISDCVMPKEFSTPSATTRRRGVQFGKLTHDQIGDLKSFIGNYAKGEV